MAAAKLRPGTDIERRLPRLSAISTARPGHPRRTPHMAAAALLRRAKASRIGSRSRDARTGRGGSVRGRRIGPRRRSCFRGKAAATPALSSSMPGSGQGSMPRWAVSRKPNHDRALFRVAGGRGRGTDVPAVCHRGSLTGTRVGRRPAVPLAGSPLGVRTCPGNLASQACVSRAATRVQASGSCPGMGFLGRIRPLSRIAPRHRNTSTERVFGTPLEPAGASPR